MKTIICGAGDVGYSIADKLSNENFEVTVIDESYEKLSKVSENLDVKTVQGIPRILLHILSKTNHDLTFALISDYFSYIHQSSQPNLLIQS